MAGTHSTIGVDYDDSQIRDALQRLNRLAGDMSPAMREIAEYLHERTRDHFDNETAPDGTPWATLTDATLKRKLKQGVPVNQILHGQSLHLRDTIFPFHSEDEAGVSTGPGTSAYAATHQFGDDSRNIQARPYLGLSPADEQEILGIIDDHIQATLKQGG